MRRGVDPVPLPGMDAAASAGMVPDSLYVRGTGDNRWLLVVADRPDLIAKIEAADAPGLTPSEVLKRCVGSNGGPPGGEALMAHVELDRCGTWVTLANSGGPRPVVLRRACWVDVRGHPPAAPLTDDRIGLGPGDSLVLFNSAWCDRCDAGGLPDGSILDPLLDVAGEGALRQVEALDNKGPRRGAVAVLAVPPDIDEDPLGRVAEATGLPVSELELPGYPLGDSQPDLWREPPRPPREARLRVSSDPSVARELRLLLRRLLASWRIDERVSGDDVELLATEVTANAIRHAGTSATAIVRFLGSRLRVEVGDGSPEMPVKGQASLEAEGGRGVPLVDALSDSWGVIPTRTGKRVWFEVPVRH
ncbi:MAG: ATP-binding protein [Actinobacteria bacterium]|nr:ATP-binding protein [Actinomycetota bacterium]